MSRNRPLNLPDLHQQLAAAADAQRAKRPADATRTSRTTKIASVGAAATVLAIAAGATVIGTDPEPPANRSAEAPPAARPAGPQSGPVGRGGTLPPARPLDRRLAATIDAFSARSPAATSDPALVRAHLLDSPTPGTKSVPVDYARAVPIATLGAPDAKAWIAPSGTRACIVTLNDAGVATTCATVREIKRGASLSISTIRTAADGPRFITASIVADRGAPPTVIRANGQRTPLGGTRAVTDNSAAELLTANDTVLYANQRVDLRRLDTP